LDDVAMSLLLILVLLPLISGVCLCVLGAKLKSTAYRIGLGVSIAMLLGSLLLVQQVHQASPNDTVDALIRPSLVYSPSWMSIELPMSIQGQPVAWQLQLGADSFSAMMVVLTCLVTLAVLVTAHQQITNRLGLYCALILITQGFLIGVFLAMDLLIFYVCFEAVLLPLILLINFWGDPKSALRASRKFLLFTLAGSIPMVIGFVGLVLEAATPERPSTVLLTELSQAAYQNQLQEIVQPASKAQDQESSKVEASTKATTLASSQTLILLTLMLGLGIKMAILPLHSWLPTTYAAAHPNTTALIAAVVGKLGVYGVLRIVLPLTPIALSHSLQMILAGLGAIAIVYGAIAALGQTELRRLLAYSSLSHMGFVTIGLMAMNREGLSGATLQMFNHGLLTSAMFLLLGMIEQRRGQIELTTDSRGLAAAYPKLGVLMVFFTLAAAGLPGLNSFVGEFLSLVGSLRVSIPLTAIAVLGTVLGAWYSLRLVQYIVFGSDGSSAKPVKDSNDLQRADLIALSPFVALVLAIGVFPSFATNFMKPDVDALADCLEPASRLIHPSIDPPLLASDSR
jgi:NADH-quinone oxidoreductase subunit M